MMFHRYYTVSGTLASRAVAGGSTYKDAVIGESPDVYLALDDSSGNFADSSGNGFTGTVYGSPSYLQTGPTVNGSVQSAVSFDGASDYAQVDDAYDDSVSGQMTISIWFKTSQAPAELCNDWLSSSTVSWRLFLDSSGAPSFYTYQSGGSLHGFTAPATGYNDGAWHHVIGWVDSSGYVNIDVDDGTATGQDSSPTGSWVGASAQNMGIACLGQSGDSLLTGSLAHLAYWDTDIGAVSRGVIQGT
jgi:hypothetical protein